MQTTMTHSLEIASARDARPIAPTAPAERVARVAVRTLAALATLFLLFDGAARLVGFAPYVQGTIQAGYVAGQAPVIGLALLAPLILLLFPRTAVLGAVLVTGYLGGAVATNLRVIGGSPWIFFPVVLGAVLWLDLWLRDPRVRAAIGPR